MKNYFDRLKRLPYSLRLISGMLFCLAITNLLSINKTSHYLSPVSFYFCLCIFPLLCIVSLFLLQLKEWARILILVLSLLAGVELALSAPGVLKRAEEYYFEQYQTMEAHFNTMMSVKNHEINLTNIKRANDATGKMVVSTEVGAVKTGILYSLFLYIVSIIYFLRPSVTKLYRNN